MQFALAFYAGPDQVMGVTSGIAGAIGVLLMFWNKVVGVFMKVVHKFRGVSPEPMSASRSPAMPPKDNQAPRA
jgi:hypothetical protein